MFVWSHVQKLSLHLFFSRSNSSYFKIIIFLKDFIKFIILYEGILGTNVSPPLIKCKDKITKFTASSMFILKRVIFLSVTGKGKFFLLILSKKEL